MVYSVQTVAELMIHLVRRSICCRGEEVRHRTWSYKWSPNLLNPVSVDILTINFDFSGFIISVRYLVPDAFRWQFHSFTCSRNFPRISKL